jgi:hypothetical protein
VDRKVSLELTETEAKRLLRLVSEEIERTEKVWEPYWLQVLTSIQAALDQADYSSDPAEEKGK